MGISYSGRTYEEGKKIGVKDGLRALYCIVRYNMPHAPLPIQFVGYLFVGGVCAIANVALFSALRLTLAPGAAAAAAFVLAAILNYILSVRLIFRSGAMWSTWAEFLAYTVVVAVAGAVDVVTTLTMLDLGSTPTHAKTIASAVALLFNFLGRRYLVFFERRHPGVFPPSGQVAVSVVDRSHSVVPRKTKVRKTV
jgi:putative flippase GtrA